MNEEQYWVIYIWNLLVKTILNIFIENSILKFPCHPLKNGDWGGGGWGGWVGGWSQQLGKNGKNVY